MSVSSVVKNIFTFANILSHAGTEVVSEWDETSLRNALNWANYCVTVEDETMGKPYRQELARCVRRLTAYLKPICLMDLQLHTLKISKHLLCKRLLHNPSTSLTLLKHIYEVMDDPRLISEYRGYRQRAMSHKRSLNQYLVLDDAGDADSLTVSYTAQQVDSLTVSHTAQQVITTLTDLCMLHTDQQCHKFQRFVEKLAHCLLCEDGGMELLGHVLLTPIREEEIHSAAESVKDLILKAMMAQGSLNSSVLGCEVGLLCQLSDRDDRFLHYYLGQLLAWGAALVPSYTLTSDGNLYSWQYSGDVGKKLLFGFQNLQKHVSQLLTYKSRLRSLVETALLEKKRQSHFNVWKDLLKAVNGPSIVQCG